MAEPTREGDAAPPWSDDASPFAREGRAVGRPAVGCGNNPAHRPRRGRPGVVRGDVYGVRADLLAALLEVNEAAVRARDPPADPPSRGDAPAGGCPRGAPAEPLVVRAAEAVRDNFPERLR